MIRSGTVFSDFKSAQVSNMQVGTPFVVINDSEKSSNNIHMYVNLLRNDLSHHSAKLPRV